jgi:hypothetical protein
MILLFPAPRKPKNNTVALFTIISYQGTNADMIHPAEISLGRYVAPHIPSHLVNAVAIVIMIFSEPFRTHICGA